MSFAALVLLTLCPAWINAGADPVTRPFLYVTCILYLVATLVATGGKAGSASRGLGTALVIGMLLVVFQLLPVPSDWSLPSLEIWRDAFPDVTSATISLDPSATRTRLALFVAAVAVWWSTTRTSLTPERTRALFWLVMANGAAISVFAVIQKLTWNGKLYWTFALGPNTTFGPMVYHNIAGAYLTFALAAGTYVLMTRPASRTRSLDPVSLTEFTLVLLTAVGLLGSLSRGAIISAAIAGAVTLIVVPLKKSPRQVGGIAVAVGGIAALLLWFGIFESVMERFGKMSGSYMAEDSRLDHWAVAWNVAQDFWLGGTGVGAYGYIVASYKFKPMTFFYAHNQYLETLVTAGVAGVLILFAAIYFVARDVGGLARYVRAGDRKPSREDMALLALATFFITSQVCHSVVDYCLSIPAIAFCLAVVTALVQRKLADVRTDRDVRHTNAAIGGAAFAVLLLAASSWAAWDAYGHARVDMAVRRLPWEDSLRELAAEDLSHHIEELESALLLRPVSPEAQEALGGLYVARYRREAVELLANETGIAVDDQNLWKWTAPEVLHNRAYQFRAAGQTDQLDDLRTQEAVSRNLVPAQAAFHRSMRACPVIPSVLTSLELLEFVQPEAEMNGQYSVAAAKCAPGDARLLYQCGSLDFGAGRLDAAQGNWRASLVASTRHLEEIVGLAEQMPDSTEFLKQVVPEEREVLEQLLAAARYESVDQEMLLAKATKLLPQTSESGDVNDLAFAALVQEKQGNMDDAVKLMREAVLLAPEQVALRFRLAQYLAAAGDKPAALREATLCLRLKNTRRHANFVKQLRGN